MKTIKLSACIGAALLLAGFIALSGCESNKWLHSGNSENDSCRLADNINIIFCTPPGFKKVAYSDFWTFYTGILDPKGCLDNAKKYRADYREQCDETWRGFYINVEDSGKKLFVSINDGNSKKKHILRKSKTGWTTLTDEYTSFLSRQVIGKTFQTELSEKIYIDTLLDTYQSALLISEVFGKNKLAWRYERLTEFSDRSYTEPIDSLYHYEITIRGGVFFIYDVARDTIFPTEEHRLEAFRIWNTIQFEE